MYAAYGREREDDDGHRIELFFPLGIGAGYAANSRRGADRSLIASQITEETIEAHLVTRFMPDPDLLIRTGGEYRISNYLLWQCAIRNFISVIPIGRILMRTSSARLLRTTSRGNADLARPVNKWL